MVSQIDNKEEAPSLDLEDLASQTHIQMGEILAAVAEVLQQMERHMQAERDEGVVREVCEVGEESELLLQSCCLLHHWLTNPIGEPPTSRRWQKGFSHIRFGQ